MTASGTATRKRDLIDRVAACNTWVVGRFASTVEFYAQYREPYLPEFFRAVAERLGLDGHEALLDVGCGPGLLAIGFAPFVKQCTGLDPEPGMIEAAKEAAAQAQAQVAFQLGRIEDFATSESFDIITIGRALHWLDRPVALAVLEKIISAKGWVLICRPTSVETPNTPWVKPYQKLCHSWSEDPERKRYRVNTDEWFAGSRFRAVEQILVTATRHVTIDDLVGRAFSRSTTSRAFMGDRQAEFAAEIRKVLEPFAHHGQLEEEIVANAAVFGFAASTPESIAAGAA